MKRLDRLRLRKRYKRRMIFKLVLAAALLGCLFLGILNFGAIRVWATKRYFSLRMVDVTIPEEEEPELYAEFLKWRDPSELLNVLFVGIDRGSVPGEDGYARSDVIILASILPEKKRAVLVSIPRDTKITIPGHGTQKINAAHAFGGPVGTVQAVKSLSGLEIHHYAEVDFEAFKKVVDAMGGVPFHVDQTINDPKAGYLPEGDYVLDGQGALIVCRSRDFPEGDLQRIENQKRFLKAAMEKMVTIRDVQSLLKILDAAVQHLQTTISPDLAFALAEYLQGMRVEDVEFVTIPGGSPVPRRGQAWYFVHDEEATARIFSNISNYCSLKTPEEEAAEKALQEQQQAAEEEARAAEKAAEEAVDRSSLKLTVLNGARREGLASMVAELMMGKGYKNIEIGNTRNTYTETTIYYSPGHEAEANVAARDLDSDNAFRIVLDAGVTQANQGDVVLVIGKDYEGT
jgi:LCP family protein required for cell wall assembly